MNLIPLALLAASFATAASPKAAPAKPKAISPSAAVTAALHSVELKKGLTLKLELMDNDSLRQKGLSGRRTLDWNQGMLFVFPNSAPRSFWMIDCHFDIDVAYINAAGVIRDIVPMRVQPGTPIDQLDRYPSSSADIMYALETNRGWFQANGLKEGDTLRPLTRWKSLR
ncbi:MAG: hypothetical protein RL318_604 [Fibrobacterota bacterium]